jgi:predicted AlkP superfamily pyrophosphatase or phosphodiesterase
MVTKKYNPTLSLVYLPHLDYCLQRVGPDDPSIAKDVREIDEVVNDLVTFYEDRGIRVVILSEYGITTATRPVSLNRVLRERGYITVREEWGGEILDPGSSKAFAVADHQVAHVYVHNSNDVKPVKKLLEAVPGVERILDAEGKKEYGLDHHRSGELVAVAEPQAWFTYYYWLEEQKAPDFAPTVSIHAKPGYDPAELLLDPAIRYPKLKAGARLIQKKLGFRYLMDLIPTDGSGVKGSHGRLAPSAEKGPLFLTGNPDLVPSSTLQPVDVHDAIWAHLTDKPLQN